MAKMAMPVFVQVFVFVVFFLLSPCFIESNTAVCRLRLPIGSYCTYDQCVVGSFCDTRGNSTCQALPVLHAACSDGYAWCADGLACSVVSLTCEQLPADGETCALSNQSEPCQCADPSKFGCFEQTQKCDLLPTRGQPWYEILSNASCSTLFVSLCFTTSRFFIFCSFFYNFLESEVKKLSIYRTRE